LIKSRGMNHKPIKLEKASITPYKGKVSYLPVTTNQSVVTLGSLVSLIGTSGTFKVLEFLADTSLVDSCVEGKDLTANPYNNVYFGNLGQDSCRGTRVVVKTGPGVQGEAKTLEILGESRYVVELLALVGNRLVLRRVEGKNLAEYLKEKKRVSYPTFLTLFYEACSCIGFLKSRGLVHNDFRPHNLIVTESLQLVVCDFEHSSPPGNLLPTTPLAAPDLVASFSSDTYSLGVTGALILKRTVGNIPTKVVNLILNSCSKDPSLRPDVEEMIRILDTINKT